MPHYGEFVREVLRKQGFEKEMESLPYPYEEPLGFILLAKIGREFAGAVAMRPLPKKFSMKARTNSESEMRVCEMKRMYVSERFRGLGIGKLLAQSCVKEAALCGYDMMVLDTRDDSIFAPARSIYEKVGFQKREPYYENDDDGMLFYELDLHNK